MATHAPFSAFVSYSSIDNSRGEIAELAHGLEQEVRIQTGGQFEIFLDQKLRPGELWSSRLSEELDRADILIPILSPSYFRSENCQTELESFLHREQTLRRNDLIFPIYFVDSPGVSHGIFDRQYFDFRTLRHKRMDSREARLTFETLALQIRDRLISPSQSRNAASSGEYWTIDNLSLENFRCFDQLNLDFKQKSSLSGEWTCLAGVNGAGKSSILQAIAIAMMGAPARDLQSGLLTRMVRRGRLSDSHAKITLTASQAESGRVAHQEVVIAPGGKLSTIGEPLAEHSVVVGYGATRNLASEQETAVKNMAVEAQRVAGLFFPLSKIAAADVLLSDRRRSQSFTRLFGELLSQIFAGPQEKVPFEVLPPDASGIAFRLASGGTVDALDLPDGFRSSAAWMADLCSTWCEVHPGRAEFGIPSEIEAVVLLDEIDLHLHPALQRELVPRLRKALPKVQWIVTTHSPLVLANFDANEIVALDSGAEGHVRALDRQIMNFTSDEIYHWLMGTSPTGAAMEEEIREADEGAGMSRDDLAAMLRVSPKINQDQAARQVAEFRGILKSIKPQSR